MVCSDSPEKDGNTPKRWYAVECNWKVKRRLMPVKVGTHINMLIGDLCATETYLGHRKGTIPQSIEWDVITYPCHTPLLHYGLPFNFSTSVFYFEEVIQTTSTSGWYWKRHCHVNQIAQTDIAMCKLKQYPWLSWCHWHTFYNMTVELQAISKD